MAELKSKKSFGLAFREAEKLGLKKFQWNGGWYTTKRADKTSALSRATGTVSNRKKVTKNGQTGYAVKEGKDGTLDAGKMGELEVVAPRLKVDRKTSGFQPVDENKNYNKANGDTRLYQERGTGRYLVTDNRDNIVGYSFDPAAATSDANWGGWIAYTGSKNDLKAAGAGKLRDEANRNEDAQKTKLAKDRITDEWDRQMGGIRRMLGGFNTVQSMINLPNHAIVGGLKMVGLNIWDGKWATEDVRNARLLEYLKGFTIDGMWKGEQEVGLGDLVEAENPYVRAGLNFVNPMTVLSAYNGYKNFTPTQRGALGRYQTKPKAGKSQQVVEYDLTGQPARVVAGKAPNGQTVVPEARFVTNKNLQTRYYTTKPETAPLSSKTGQVGARYRNTGSNNAENIKRLDLAGRFMSHLNWAVEGTPFTMTPFNAAFRYDPNVSYNWEESVPVANFWYSGEGNPNTYAQGRIATGEVVPGTSGENWSGGQSGGTVVVDNTNGHVSPAFGGVTVGGGRDNQSSWYLPLAYKKGGKAKLISKKSCRK